MNRIRAFVAILGVFSFVAVACAGVPGPAPVVSHVTLDLSPVTLPTFPDRATLVENLERSPLWHVSRDRAGGVVASLRVVTGGDFSNTSLYLSEWVAAGRPAVDGEVRIDNAGWRSREVVDLDVRIQTSPPDEAAAILGTRIDLPVHAGFMGDKLDGNSWSMLTLLVADGVWLTIREQGDQDRAATRRALDVAVAELRRLAGLPASYLAREVYADVFAALGGPAPHAVRYAGMQDRDTLGLVFEAVAGRDYQGVQMNVWEPTICHGECTADYRQKGKAVLLGHPPPGDWGFALVEDNAVFLGEAENQKYGIFSGGEAFDAEIRWSDAGGQPFWTGRGSFRGWER